MSEAPLVRILLLKGGNSPEREVSLRSAAAVSRALIAAGYEVHEYDTIDGFNGILKFKDKVDLVLPVLHGIGGEDGTVQRFLESHRMIFLGSGSEASELSFDKQKFKDHVTKYDIPTPSGKLVDKESVFKSELIAKPFALKPYDGGSSVDTIISRQLLGDDAQVRDVFKRHKNMLLEELIEGKEITVPILGNEALPVIEIIPPEGGEFDYENKYNGLTQEICPPNNVSEQLQEQAKILALKVHEAVGARHFSRVDIMIDSHDNLFVLEINTIPGLTEQSLLPKSAQVYGLDMVEFVKKLVDLGLSV
jgi:D-alanine-D-alanine ligase